MVRVRGHPRAGSSPYVFEHILLAEEVIGRHLVDGESVQHINGVRDDNRPENLELWTMPQLSGIRVSDAIEWARSIYDLYLGPGTPPTVLTVSPEHRFSGGGGNRTRVLRLRSWPSPSAADPLNLGTGAAIGKFASPQSAEMSPAARRRDRLSKPR